MEFILVTLLLFFGFFLCLSIYWIFKPALESTSKCADNVHDTFFSMKTEVEECDQIEKSPSVDISFVIPAYNEEARLPPMISSTLEFMRLWSIKRNITYEIIVVDDGSSDGTVDYVKSLMAEKDGTVKLLKLGKNRGKGGAVKRGVRRCMGKYILMVDADGASEISELDRLYNEIKSVEKDLPHLGDISFKYGVAIGSRAHMQNDSVNRRAIHRTILMYGFHLLVTILITKNIQDTQCGFKLFSRRAAEVLFKNLNLERWSFDIELIYVAERLGIPIVEVPIKWQEVDGSKLIQQSSDVIMASLNMARDMLCTRLSYVLGVWKIDSVNRSLDAANDSRRSKVKHVSQQAMNNNKID